MTIDELKGLVPGKSIIYSSIEGRSVQCIYDGKDEKGNNKLHGLPFSYEDYLLLEYFGVLEECTFKDEHTEIYLYYSKEEYLRHKAYMALRGFHIENEMSLADNLQVEYSNIHEGQ